MRLTLNPLPPVDTTTSHDGLIFLTFIMAAVLLGVQLVNSNTIRRGVYAVLASLWVWTAWVSFHSGVKFAYVNEPVEATLAGFIAEGHSELVKSGKQYRNVDVHNFYVIYKYNGVVVTFNASPGGTWPEKAILYKN